MAIAKFMTAPAQGYRFTVRATAAQQPELVTQLHLFFWQQSLLQWLPAELSHKSIGPGLARAIRHIAQVCGGTLNDMRSFLRGEFFQLNPDMDSGAFSAPSIDHFTHRLDHLTLTPFIEPMLVARRQAWSPEGERLLTAQQVKHMQVAIGLRHLVWSQVMRALLRIQKRQQILNNPSHYYHYMDRTQVLQNALIDGVQATQDLLALLHADSQRAVAQTTHASTVPSMSVRRPTALRRWADAAEYLQTHYSERSSEATQLDWPSLPRLPAQAQPTKRATSEVVGRVAGAMLSVSAGLQSQAVTWAPLAATVAPRVAYGSAQPVVGTSEWVSHLFTLLTPEQEAQLGLGADDLLGLALGRNSVPLERSSLFIPLDPATTGGRERVYFFRIPVKGSQPDWRALLSESDLAELGASLPQIQIVQPGQAVPVGATLLRKTARWRGQVHTVTFYVLSGGAS